MRRFGLGMFCAAGLVAAALGATALGAAERGREFADGPGWSRGPGGGEWGPRRAWSRLAPEDRAAFADARLAAMRAGLKLNADQERLWPPVEEAIRNLGKVRRDAFEAMRARRETFTGDVPGALRAMADAQAGRADALRRLADAAAPLYATFDEGQKRRALVLARPMGPWARRMMEHRDAGPRE